MQYLRDNIYITAPLPLDGKYMKASLQGATPYVSTTDANTEIPDVYRHIGLTVCIDDGTGLKEYWYKEGIEDSDLVLKFDASTGGGTGTTTMILNETPSGIKDGVNTIFNTTYEYASSTTCLYLNGQRLKLGLSFDYTESDVNEITFIFPPESTDIITMDYEVGIPTGATVFNETPTGTINGINTVFTTVLPYIGYKTRLYLNGQRLRMGILYDYTESGLNEITFNVAPETDDNISIDYDY